MDPFEHVCQEPLASDECLTDEEKIIVLRFRIQLEGWHYAEDVTL